MGNVVFHIDGEADMQLLAQMLAKNLVPGDRLLLHGDLGAGKTTFVKGLVSALGSTEEVTSPTFGLIHQYDLPAASLPIKKVVHMDAYRLDSKEANELDLAFYEQPGSVMIIEWAERFAATLEGLHLFLFFGEHDTQRRVEVRFVGERTFRFKAYFKMQV